MSTEPEYIKKLFYKARGAGAPLSGTFELTSRCNLSCRMCYIHQNNRDELVRRELTAKQWLEIAEAAAENGTLLLLLTGGEPLIRRDFEEIYLACKRLGFSVCLNTNGTLINDEIISLFKEYMPARVNLSLYGASPEAYERVCGNAQAYEKAFSNALALKAAGIPVKINFSVSQYNREDIGAVYSWAIKNEICIEGATYMFPPVRAGKAAAEADRMPPEIAALSAVECEQSCFSRADYLRRARVVVNKKRPDGVTASCVDEAGEHIFCRAGTSTFWISWDGKMTPCGMMYKPACDVTSTGFAAAWNEVHARTADIILPSECSSCSLRPICDVCAASCLAETGAFGCVPEYQCKKARAFYEISAQNLAQAAEENGGEL